MENEDDIIDIGATTEETAPTLIDQAFLTQLEKKHDLLEDIRNASIMDIENHFGCNVEDARKIQAFAFRQQDLDLFARAPASTEDLNKLLDVGFRDEIVRLIEERHELNSIVAKGTNGTFERTQKFKRIQGPALTVSEARERLDNNTLRLMDLRKCLAQSAPKTPKADGNVTVDLGSIVNDILNNVKRDTPD